MKAGWSDNGLNIILLQDHMLKNCEYNSFGRSLKNCENGPYHAKRF